MKYESWGRTPKADHQVTRMAGRSSSLPELPADGTILPYGCGRSYGDSCLNNHEAGQTGHILATDNLDRFIAFCPDSGLLTVEAGVTLADILDFAVPKGWFLPVSPGTKFVSVGGAIANDIHGKNHHVAGTFGNHISEFEILRSDGTRMCCSPTENPTWFRATIGGLGLTGMITWASIKLKSIHNPYIDVEHIKFGGLNEFFQLVEESDEDYEYTVSWVDVLAKGDSLGRGIFMRGNHAGPELPKNPPPARPSDFKATIPFDAPGWLLNRFSIWGFNALYYNRQLAKHEHHCQHYEPFFYPLDAVLKWNKLYGKRGLFQHQCVVPYAQGDEPIREILKSISDAGEGSFLAVLKVFGDVESLGLMSFPRAGVTLTLDFPNRGQRTLDLLARLDAITAEAGGAVYPAKDARMAGHYFRSYFPHWRELEPFIDPKFSSSFWRRVTQA